MICGVVVQGMMLTYMTWRTDWNEQVDERKKKWCCLVTNSVYYNKRIYYFITKHNFFLLQVRKTSERLNRWFLKPSEESNEGPFEEEERD